MDSPGATVREPEAERVPSPAMEISLALAVCQERVLDCPGRTTAGLAARVAVGACGAGAGGGGGTTLAVFLAHPADRARMAVKAAMRANAVMRGYDISWCVICEFLIIMRDCRLLIVEEALCERCKECWYQRRAGRERQREFSRRRRNLIPRMRV